MIWGVTSVAFTTLAGVVSHPFTGGALHGGGILSWFVTFLMLVLTILQPTLLAMVTLSVTLWSSDILLYLLGG